MPVKTIGRDNSPKPSFRRLMSFVDGENLVFSYQRMIKEGKIPSEQTKHRENIYVWNRNSIDYKMHDVLRSNYYTYAVGSEEVIDDVKAEIKSLTFPREPYSQLPTNLTPIVFKKTKKSKKTKGVDIKMTVDILTHSYFDNLDTVLLVAGDGDYLPIIEEVKRMGKLVYLSFFSKGLNENLINHVDKFILLDDVYFNK